MQSRTETVLLAILELLGLAIAVYGLYFPYVVNATLAGIFYCSVWYAFGFISNLLGIVSIYLERVENELKGDSQTVLQFHYMTAWLSVIIGYPLLVTYTWLMLFPTLWSHLHLVLSITPIIVLMADRHWIVRATQICVGATAASHLFICGMAGEFYGVMTAGSMIINIVALSTPTRFHLWEFNSREMLIIGLVITSVCMNASVMDLGSGKFKGFKLF